MRVIVTGVGGGVGQGIIKALRFSTLPIHVIAADISPLNAGLYAADEAVILPPVEEQNSLEKTIDILKNLNADALLVGSEFDLVFYAENKETIEENTGIIIIVSPAETVHIAQDKFLTAQFLEQNGLPFAKSYASQSEEEVLIHGAELGYPLILKPRTGTSSRYVHVVQTPEKLRDLFSSVPNPMVQSLIAEPSDDLGAEYTCSAFDAREGNTLGPFTAKRTVRGGTSWRIEVDNFPSVGKLVSQVAQQLPSIGSINLQLMVGPDGPIPFEINARFSGTTAVRAYFGFNEPEMALKSWVLGETLQKPSIRKGVTLRYIEEIFLDDVNEEQLGKHFPKGKVNGWFQAPLP